MLIKLDFFKSSLLIFSVLFLIKSPLRVCGGPSGGENGRVKLNLKNSHEKNGYFRGLSSLEQTTGVYQHLKYNELKWLRSKDERYLDKSLRDLDYCKRPGKCEVLNYTSCMGSKLPYESSTLDLTNLKSQNEVQEQLQQYQYLKYIPKCWAVIQPFLCALYMPKCENGEVYLPSKEMCRITLNPCKILYESGIFPDFMRCDDEDLFPSECKNDIHELKFNTTGQCMEPLVRTDHPDWVYSGIEGCGLRCKDSLFTENEHQQIQKLIAYCTLLCIFLHLFTVVTFLVDWKTANKYPALAIFYINFCFLISYNGWLVQFLGHETSEDIVCKKDGTLRKSEPSASENLSCVIVFVMVYYFLIAGMVWFVIFTYAWYMSSLQALGKIQERVDKKRAYFHLIAWSLPLMLTITTMALGEIDGDYVTGICFVGYINSAARTGLLLTPLAGVMLMSSYIIVKGLLLLIKVKIDSRDIISEHSSRKIRSNIVRMGVFALFMLVFCFITFIYHGYWAENSHIWNKSLEEYIFCKLTSLSPDHTQCRQENRPSVAMLQLQLIAVFGAGIAMASWIWCSATIHAWTRYIRRYYRKFHCEIEEPMKLQKHKIIAEAFAKRKKFNQGGRISIEFQKHTDPVGLHFDLNSAASNELSTTWAANLPRLVNRRGAVPNEATCSISSNNQSIDSEMSYSVRHVSIESRRNSGDSQLSVQIAEVKATRKVNHRHRGGRNRYGRHKKHSFRRNSRDVGGMSKNPKNNSNTSIDSAFLLNMLTNTTDSKTFAAPNLNRRSANAGLDGTQIKNLLSTGKLVIPYGKNVRSGSEDENVSVTISESKFNVVVSNHNGSAINNNMDLNDQLMMESLKKGLHIEEINTTSGEENKEDGSRSSRQKKKLCKRKSRCSSDSSDSSCPELKQLVQSSLNSGNSIFNNEMNRDSKQSKASADVACQANAGDIISQTSAIEGKDCDGLKCKVKRGKSKENKRYKVNKHQECVKGRDRYKSSEDEFKVLKNRKESKFSDDNSDDELLGTEKYKVKVRKSKDF